MAFTLHPDGRPCVGGAEGALSFAMSNNVAARPPKHGWQHSNCCDAGGCFAGKGCFGCCDRGCCYIVKHACCLPCTFGRIAEKGANGDYSVCCCGLACGAAIGAHFVGAPILPCVVSARRSIVDKCSARVEPAIS